jgi:hypothetical protein
MFVPSIGIGELLLRVAVVYAGVFLLLRLVVSRMSTLSALLARAPRSPLV